MDGSGHTAIFFRLDSLIRSLVLHSENKLFHIQLGLMRDYLLWRGCCIGVFVQTAMKASMIDLRGLTFLPLKAFKG